MVDMFEGKVVAYMCRVCGYPCIFLSQPKPGDSCHGCWEGRVIWIGEPDKEGDV